MQIKSVLSLKRTLRYRYLKKKHRNQVRKKTPPYTHCKNCGTELYGMFCSHCGQYALDIHQSLGRFIHEYFTIAYQLDAHLVKTLKILLLKPGKLTEEYRIGHIAAYVHPVKLYMFFSLIFFLLLFFILSHAGPKLDSESFSSQASSLFVMSQKDTVDLDESVFLKNTTALLFSFIQSYMPLILPFLLPFYALLLRWFFRKYTNYIIHLVFAIHIHAFLFLLWLTLLGFSVLFWDVDWVQDIVLLSSLILPFIYSMAATKNFYKEAWKKVVGKSILIYPIYVSFALVVSTLVFVIILAIKWSNFEDQVHENHPTDKSFKIEITTTK